MTQEVLGDIMSENIRKVSMIQKHVSWDVNHDIVINQNEDVATTFCFIVSPPSWLYTAPTLQLEERGLTLNVLTQIIHTINNNALKDYENNYHPKGGYHLMMPIVGFFVGFALFFTGIVVTPKIYVFLVLGIVTMVASIVGLVCAA